MLLKVACYSGYKGEERPVHFWLGDTCLEVETIEDRWYSPGCTVFRVVVASGDRYLLRYHEGQQTWELQGFRAAGDAFAAPIKHLSSIDTKITWGV